MRRILIITLLIISMIAVIGCSNKNAQYKDELQQVVKDMVKVTEKAEPIINDYSLIWEYTIKSKGSITTGELATFTGLKKSDVIKNFSLNSARNIDNDFSVTVSGLKSYFDSADLIPEIDNMTKDIKEKLSDLKNPSDEFKDTYNEALDMYEYTEEYTDMAIDPSGSLTEFNNNATKLSKDILAKQKRIEVIMPD